MNHSKLWLLGSQSKNKIISITLSILLFMGIYVVALSIEQYNTVQAQGQSHNTTNTNTATPMNPTSANATKPVDGHGGPPTGPLNVVRHVFDDPTLRVISFL